MGIDRNSPRICFVHNRVTQYRKPLFDRLAGEYDADFFFANTAGVGLPGNSTVLKGYTVPKMSGLEIVPGLRGALARRGPYDLYFSGELGSHYMWATCGEAVRRKRPYSIWASIWKEVKHPRYLFSRGWETRFVRGAHSIITYNEKGRDFVVKERGADPSRVFVAYNSVERISLPPPPPDEIAGLRERYGAGDRKIVLLMGRLVPFKGPEYLLKAFQEIEEDRDDAFLLVAGTGPMLDPLRNLADKLCLRNCRFTGEYVNAAAKNLLLSAAYTIVLPSVTLATSEPWGLVMNEGAQFGLPLVCTDSVGAHGELVLDGVNGFVVPERNPAALADAIIRLLENPETARMMGGKARERVNEICTIDRMLETFRKAFKL